MDRRLELVRRYYAPLSTATVKLETTQHGFGFLEALTRRGARLEYGELTLHGALHKYKLSGVPPEQWDELLADHVAKRANVCLYFGPAENALFAFNLDNNRREKNTEVIPEMTLAVAGVRERLEAHGLRPLVIASGRGYHIWCRLDAPRRNEEIYRFMLSQAVQTAAGIHFQGGDRRRVKFNFYPDPHTDNLVSLRLFGSDHAKNQVFSRVFTRDGLLDEPQSWDWFERHVNAGPVSAGVFDAALKGSGTRA